MGCSKEKISQGLYSCSAEGTTLYIELLAGEDCILYFQGGRESSGFYHIKGDEITIIGHATLEKKYSYVSYHFSYETPGKILSKDKFSITAEELGNDETHYCSFVRRQ